MKRALGISLAILGVLLVAALVASCFVPLREVRTQYCFYCGRMSTTHRVLNLPVWKTNHERSIYDDSLTIPAHSHHLIELGKSRVWLFNGSEHWDEFGWTGDVSREVLVDAIGRQPGCREQILEEFLAIDASDHESIRGFIEAHRVVNGGARHGGDRDGEG